MKKTINIVGVLCVASILILVFSCKNNKVVRSVDTTDQIDFREVICIKDSLEINLNKVTILNTRKNTNSISHHDNLSVELSLILINNYSESLTFFSEEENKKAFFKGMYSFKEKNDTINFYSFRKHGKYLIPSKDSLVITLGTYFNFEKLIENPKDYTTEMIELISNFQLLYINKDNRHCVTQEPNQIEVKIVNSID